MSFSRWAVGRRNLLAAHFIYNATKMSTIVDRKRKQSLECSTFLLQVRFMTSDAKSALQSYAKDNPLLMKTPLSKQQVKEIYFRGILEHLPRKGVDGVAEFLFSKALKNEYIVKVPKIWQDDQDEFCLNPEILSIKTDTKEKGK